MLVLVVEVLAGVGVLFAVAVLVTGRAGAMTGAAPDRAPVELPRDRPVTGADLARVRFGVAFRGYRMDDVDTVLDRLATELEDRDARLAGLEGAPAAGVDGPPGVPGEQEPSATAHEAPEVPAPPSVPSLPSPDDPASGPLTVPPAAWEDTYAGTPTPPDEEAVPAWGRAGPAAGAEDGAGVSVDDAWGDERAAWADASAGWADPSAGWADPNAGWADDGGRAEASGWSEDGEASSRDGEAWSGDNPWVAGDGTGSADEDAEASTEEWRALYDELRPVEPHTPGRGAGPRRIGGAWEPAAAPSGAAPDDRTDRPAEDDTADPGEARRADEEGGPWPSSW